MPIRLTLFGTLVVLHTVGERRLSVGKTAVNYLLTGVEYGTAALGAIIASKLALLMCLFNAASLGANMAITGIFEFVRCAGSGHVVRKFGSTRSRYPESIQTAESR